MADEEEQLTVQAGVMTGAEKELAQVAEIPVEKVPVSIPQFKGVYGWNSRTD
jgi:isoaspartyl peptidase/L-asparaginase-like protein (Ntn-hydrolase superfamily)